MAVQKHKKTRSRRGMRRSHDALSAAPVNVNPLTGEQHLRHHIDDAGFYGDKQVTSPKWGLDDADAE